MPPPPPLGRGEEGLERWEWTYVGGLQTRSRVGQKREKRGERERRLWRAETGEGRRRLVTSLNKKNRTQEERGGADAD